MLTMGYGEAFALFTNESLAVRGVVGSYVNQSLRFVDEPDWRLTQPISGTRVDAALFFSTPSLGMRNEVGITGGSDQDWNDFSVQWDGVIQILQSDTRLATHGNAGSRMWLDLNGNGDFDDLVEQFDNSWGTAQERATGASSPPLSPGTYPMRIQFEDTGGSDSFSLIANPLAPRGSFDLFTNALLTTPGLVGSYVNQSLRDVDEVDWRATQTVAGTRVDPTIDFRQNNWGNRADIGLTGGSDADWEDYSVQWDGVVEIVERGTCLATRSDDGSRMWLDLDLDGAFADAWPELVDNHWGSGQSVTSGPCSNPLKPGVYPIRIQYEEGFGGNFMQLVSSGEPILRIAYVIPADRVPQATAASAIQDFVPRMQSFFSDQMARFGLGAKTFVVETEIDGTTPRVHVVHVGATDDTLRTDIWGQTLSAAATAGVPVWSPREVWLVIPEAHLQLPDGSVIGGTALGAGFGDGDSGGVAMLGSDSLFRLTTPRLVDERPYAGEIVPVIGPYPLVQDVSFPWFEYSTFSSIASSIQGAIAHEVGHAFGLSHDFRNDENFRGTLMGNGLRGWRGAMLPEAYPTDDTRLSYAAALALSVNAYFNPQRATHDSERTALTVSTSGDVPAVDGLLRIDFDATDLDGLAVALLQRDGNTIGEMRLSGTSANTSFRTPYYEPDTTESFTVTVYDTFGNRQQATTNVRVVPGTNRAPQVSINTPNSHSTVGRSIVLNALATSDPDHSAASLLVEWDLNNDGHFDTVPTTNREFVLVNSQPGTRIVTARVTDPAGGQSVASPLALRIDPLNPLPWHNPRNPIDVNRDTLVAPIDALIVINELNDRQYSDTLGRLPTNPESIPACLDTNGDNFASAIDALLVINFLNDLASGEGELATESVSTRDVINASSVQGETSSTALPPFAFAIDEWTRPTTIANLESVEPQRWMPLVTSRKATENLQSAQWPEHCDPNSWKLSRVMKSLARTLDELVPSDFRTFPSDQRR